MLVGGRAVCRRCLALYPTTVLVLLLQYTPAALPAVADPWLYLLAAPAAVDFVLERLGWTGYRPGRVVVVAMLLAIPLGRGFFRYLENPLDPWFWGLVGLFGVPTVVAALWRGWRDQHRRTPSETERGAGGDEDQSRKGS